MSDIQEEQKRLYKRAEENDKKILEKELEELRDIFNYEKDLRIKSEKEINRLNNIIDEKDYKIKRIVYSCYESDMSYEEFKAIWVNAFEKLYDPKDIDKLENELKGDNK